MSEKEEEASNTEVIRGPIEEMERNIKKRDANKNVVLGLINQAEDIVDVESKAKEVNTYLKTIQVKMTAIKKLNEDILDEIEHDKISDEIEEATNFEVKVTNKCLLADILPVLTDTVLG